MTSNTFWRFTALSLIEHRATDKSFIEKLPLQSTIQP